MEYEARFVVEEFMGLVCDRFAGCVGVLDGLAVGLCRVMVEEESLWTHFCRIWSVCGRLGSGDVSDMSSVQGVSDVCEDGVVIRVLLSDDAFGVTGSES